MNYFYKFAVTAALTILTIGVNAQDLAHKIPADALAVATIKGENLTNLMSVKEFNKTFIGREMIEKLAKSRNQDFKTVEDFGINLSSTFYYYNQSNDSVSYNCFLAPLKNAAQLEALFTKKDKKFTVNGKLRSYHNHDSTEVVLWNDEMLLLVVGSGKDKYFSIPEVGTRLGIKSFSADPLTDTVTTADPGKDFSITPSKEPSFDETEEAAIAPPKILKKAKPGKKKLVKPRAKLKKGHKPAKIVKKKPAEEEIITEAPVAMSSDTVILDDAATAAYSPVTSSADSLNDQNEKLKKAAVARWTNDLVNNFFTKKDAHSILDNKDFRKSIDQDAEITIWISGAEKLMNTYVPLSMLRGFNPLGGFGSANAKLYLEKESMRISASLTLSDEMAAVSRKLNKRKLNKKFLKYINEDNLIGYMAFALDSKVYLQEYPKLLSKIYTASYVDEINMATDLFSLLLDEEAVSKVIKGDGMLVFNGLSQKEVTYQTNEYSAENFETKEVTKTKNETIPDFLFMVSSEDTRLIDKLIAYGIKKQAVKNNDGYFELSIPKSPVALYFAIKDGVIFFGTNSNEMKQIVTGSYQSNLSARHKKLLTANNYSCYFSPKKLAGKIPAEEFSPSKMEKINKTLNALGDIYVKSSPINGNIISGELSMDIPSNQQNALKYMFSILEDIDK